MKTENVIDLFCGEDIKIPVIKGKRIFGFTFLRGIEAENVYIGMSFVTVFLVSTFFGNPVKSRGD